MPDRNISDQYEVTQDRINDAMDSINDTAEGHHQAPSKLFGGFHAVKGTAVEKIGDLAGWTDWQTSGQREHERGQEEYDAAESWWPKE